MVDMDADFSKLQGLLSRLFLLILLHEYFPPQYQVFFLII